MIFSNLFYVLELFLQFLGFVWRNLATKQLVFANIAKSFLALVLLAQTKHQIHEGFWKQSYVVFQKMATSRHNLKPFMSLCLSFVLNNFKQRPKKLATSA